MEEKCGPGSRKINVQGFVEVLVEPEEAVIERSLGEGFWDWSGGERRSEQFGDPALENVQRATCTTGGK